MTADRSKYFEIILKGEAEKFLPAERAVLNIEVAARDLDKQSAAKHVLLTARRVETLLTQLAPQTNTIEARIEAAVDYWSRTSLSESSDPAPGISSKSEAHYIAKVEFEARFQNFAAISGLTTDLALISPLVQTKPVQWILQEATKDTHRAELRAKAARNAYQKAVDYAQAMGYSNITPYQLKESSANANSSKMKGGRMPSSTSERTAKNLAEILGLKEVSVGSFLYQPDDIRVSVVVEAIFHATT
ncbi:hypothetical protein CB0940_10144 [Cercospora beticola]|uniref:SIMPL domain-containing protein n=1 Tax=Cercospora beticola TaxID=122368 RepID=A0A2G5HSX2_CERBT|nr:hypothetical protein CB0940_10144 [Cercospora beticola]PIA95637.1 hypothetical protein CB0940_10144 [Cercospora beticola]WPB06851.1 hypothetical protein RHO25_011511 [Cercospora beticola]CAK1366775.1 unnamed protein product [Cercospora beticola]